MKGFELKELLASKGIVFSELASKLALTPRGLMHKFEVKNIKPDFLHKIEEAVGFKIESLPPTSTENQQLIELLKKKDEQIDRLISLLEQRSGNDNSKEKSRVG